MLLAAKSASYLIQKRQPQQDQCNRTFFQSGLPQALTHFLVITFIAGH
jgi:hypothetical protein